MGLLSHDKLMLVLRLVRQLEPNATITTLDVEFQKELASDDAMTIFWLAILLANLVTSGLVWSEKVRLGWWHEEIYFFATDGNYQRRLRINAKDRAKKRSLPQLQS